eukprot:1403461-Pyramimonas_sp.AAC.1
MDGVLALALLAREALAHRSSGANEDVEGVPRQAAMARRRRAASPARVGMRKLRCIEHRPRGRRRRLEGRQGACSHP